jgi:hypothetical protein
MRCKACDILMTDEELKKLDKLTGEYTELCSDCEEVSNYALYDYEEDEDDISMTGLL